MTFLGDLKRGGQLAWDEMSPLQRYITVAVWAALFATILARL